MRHMVLFNRQVGNIEAQHDAMIVYEAEDGFKLLSKMAVSSKEGAKREQKGCKEGAKREQKGSKEALGLEHVAVRWGERGAYATLDPCLRRILT